MDRLAEEAEDGRLVVVYERVSSDKQDISRQTRQRERARSDLPEREVEVIQDDGVSAYKISIFDRPGGARLVQLIEAGRVEAIYVDAQDRLSRGDDLEWVTFRTLCETNGARIIVDGNELRADLGGRMEGYLKALLARQESVEKSHRVRGGKRRAVVERGQRNGGPRPYGYDQKEKQLVPRRAEFAVLRRIRREILAGTPQSAVAAGLNADGVRTVRGARWSQARIGQTVRNPLYAGWVRHRDEHVHGKHEPVFTQAEHEELLAYLAARARVTLRGGGRPTSGTHLFVGRLLRCGCCGSSIVPRTTRNAQGRRYELYRCLGQLQGSSPDCPMPSVRRELIDEAVLAYFERVGVDVDATRRHFAEQFELQGEEVLKQAKRAEREALQAAAAVAKAESEWAAGELGGKTYERLTAKYDDQRRAAEAEAAQLRERGRELAADGETLDAEEEALRFLADLRAAIAGTVSDAGSVAAVRAALVRLFDGFTLHSYEAGIREDSPIPDGWVRSRLYFEPELLMVGGFHVETHPKSQVILGADKQIEFPELVRTGLATRETTIASRP